MSTLRLNVNAEAFSSVLGELQRSVSSRVGERESIPVSDVFDSPALRVKNPAGQLQVQSRQPIEPSHNGKWVSPGSFVPMRLRYELHQSNRPLRIDLSVRRDLELAVRESENSKLNIDILSQVSASILDPVVIGGVNTTISDALFLKWIMLSAGEVRYGFRRREDSTDYIEVVAAWSTEAIAKFGKRSVEVEFSKPSIATKSLSHALAIATPEMKCGGGGGGGGGGDGDPPQLGPLDFIRLDLRRVPGVCSFPWDGKVYYLRNIHPDRTIEVIVRTTVLIGSQIRTSEKPYTVSPSDEPKSLGCNIPPGSIREEYRKALVSAVFVS
ncbi:MAG: hypothetical protein ACTS10_22180 [Kiloniellales bacterium]